MTTQTAGLQLQIDATQVQQATLSLNALDSAAENAEQGVQGLGQQSQQTAAQMNALGQSSNSAASFMARNSQVFGAAGLQLQDVVVQAQMGTSAFTIIAQQGSVEFHSRNHRPGGAVIGAVIALSAALGGVLWAALRSSSNLIDELALSAEELADSLEKVTTVAIAQNAINQITKDSEKAAEAIKDTEGELKKLQERVERRRDIVFRFEAMQDEFGDLEDVVTEKKADLQEAIDAVTELQSKRDQATNSIKEQAKQIAELVKIRDRLAAGKDPLTEDDLRRAKQFNDRVDRLTQSLQIQAETLGKTKEQTRELAIARLGLKEDDPRRG